jgi:hypothetical protein
MCDGTIGRNKVTETQREIYKIDHMLVSYGHNCPTAPIHVDQNRVEITWA